MPKGLRTALLLLVVMALLPRFILPSGYMPGSGDRLTLMLCSGTASVTVDLGRHHGKHDAPANEHAPCAFAASAMPLISATPPALLAQAIVYGIRHGTDPRTGPVVSSASHLRPPLRGPPVA